MRITKFVHSCLLIEDQGKTVLIDPGSFSVEEKALDINSITNLDYLLITHKHFDHMHIPTVKQLAQKFPNLKIMSNDSVKTILTKEGLTVLTTGDESIQLFDQPHEKIFGSEAPQNTRITVFGKLTHPGDSLTFTQTTDILALPVQAPWGSLFQAVEKAEEFKEKVKIIIPIHDWHWNDNARNGFYERLTQHFAQFNIRFIGINKGSIDI